MPFLQTALFTRRTCLVEASSRVATPNRGHQRHRQPSATRQVVTLLVPPIGGSSRVRHQVAVVVEQHGPGQTGAMSKRAAAQPVMLDGMPVLAMSVSGMLAMKEQFPHLCNGRPWRQKDIDDIKTLRGLAAGANAEP